ncbi:MAG: di-trans,poly-cis-decaprenylcistransferase [Acidobacteria bacterium]|nr:MAG: di-trans,poly-cis-decaprenylcistransferase [Acidobacteriota bacterium]
MDGNGRWARARGLPRTAGHREGAKAVRSVVEAAPDLGITTLTLYAFSADNWQRPAAEVRTLMELFERFLHSERDKCIDNGVLLNIIGRRDRFEPRLLRAIRRAEAATAGGRNLHLRIAVDYSARQALIDAAGLHQSPEPLDVDSYTELLNRAVNSRPAAPDVDLLIRTSGEQRLSDFLLWECAYAELSFTDCLWPDFDGAELERAVAEFHRRERRFGRVVEARELAS